MKKMMLVMMIGVLAATASSFGAVVWYENGLLNIEDDFSRAASNDLGYPWHEYESADNIVRVGSSQTAVMLPDYGTQAEAGFSGDGLTITNGSILVKQRLLSVQRSGWFGVSYRALTQDGGANIAGDGYNVRVRTMDWSEDDALELRYGSEVLASTGLVRDSHNENWIAQIEVSFFGNDHEIVLKRNPGTQWEQVLGTISYTETVAGRDGAGYFGGGTSNGWNQFTEFNVYEAVPEPATMTLLGLGCVSVLAKRKRQVK